MVDAMGYPSFFLFTAILGLPVLLLILVIGKRFETRDLSSRQSVKPGES
jgi:SNF family Na+-dependent transporter